MLKTFHNVGLRSCCTHFVRPLYDIIMWVNDLRWFYLRLQSLTSNHYLWWNNKILIICIFKMKFTILIIRRIKVDFRKIVESLTSINTRQGLLEAFIYCFNKLCDNQFVTHKECITLCHLILYLSFTCKTRYHR